VGLDPWGEGLRRALRKRERWPVARVDLVGGDGARMPFRDGSFDLVVSNLGINNFEQPEQSLAEARRVLRPSGVLALATNRAGHMRELYQAFERALSDDAPARERLRAQVERRGTVDSLKARLDAAGFEVLAVHEREAVLRFTGGDALFEHHLVRIGFLAGWEEIAGNAATLTRLKGSIDALARERGEVRLTVPLVYLEARAL
jgi:SAM-dependent methyltransferase